MDFVDITFTEEVKNGEDKNAYSLPQTGGAVNGLQIQSVQKISQYTYRVFLGGGSIATGQIRIYFTNIRDYNGNALSGPNYVDYTGSANIPITLSVTYLGRPVYGVSDESISAFSASRYSSVDITFRHDFKADNANSYEIYQKTGATACSGTLIGSGSNLQHSTSITPITRAAATFSTTPAVSRIVVCVTNQNNPTAIGVVSWQIVRDDDVPTVSRSIPPGDYPSPQTFSLTCVDNNPDSIAYTSAMQKDTAPTAPGAPGFDSAGVINATSNLYAGSLTAVNPLNPTYSIFRWQCIDKAGNRSAIPAAEQYYIDNTIPAVNITVDGSYRSYLSNAVNPATTIKFTTDQANRNYHIRRNGTNCTGGGDGTAMVSSTTPATAGTLISHTLTTGTHFTAEGSYDVRICVQGPTSVWGTAYLQITRDDTAPVITPTVTTGTYPAVQAVEYTCTDTNLDKAAYRINSALGGIAPTPVPTPPTFNTATGDLTSSNNLTGPYTTPDASTTIVAYGCIDKAGNQATTGSQQYTIDGTVPAVTLVSVDHSGVTTNAAGYTSVNITWNTSKAGVNYPGNNYQVRVGATTCSNGTVAASGLTPATPGTNVFTTLPATAFPSNGQTYAVKICVANYAGVFGSQTTPITVTRDDTPPTFAGLSGISSTVTGVYTLAWLAADETGGSGVQRYNLYQSNVSASYATTPSYTAAAAAIQHTVTGLNPPDIYYFIAGAIDNAGNETKVTAVELRTLFNLRVAVTGYTAGAGDFRVQQGSDTLAFNAAPGGTQTFATGFVPGANYSISITAQPTNQICSFLPKQFGTITTDLTLQVQCLQGQWVGGNYQATAPVPLNYLLYRGKVTTLAGNGSPGFADNTTGTSAQFTNPEFMVYLNNALYVADSNNRRVRKVDLSGSNAVTTIAGSATAAVGDTTDDNSDCALARFGTMTGIATDGVNLYTGEYSPARRIRKISNIGGTCSVTTLAGAGAYGYVNGPAATAQFSDIYGIVSDGTNLYVSENGNNRIRKIDLATGIVSTIAGNGAAASVDSGTGTSASFNSPTGMTVIGSDLFLADACWTCSGSNGNTIRKISLIAPYPVTTVAGVGGTAALVDGPGNTAKFYTPIALTTDGTFIFVADLNNSVIRRIDPKNGYRVSTLAGSGTLGHADGTGPNAVINRSHGVATDGRVVYFGEWGGHRIKKLVDSGLIGYWAINPGVNPNDYSSDNGAPTSSTVVNGPLSTTVDRFNTGNAASLFNGTNQYVSAGSGGLPTDLDQPVTLAAWVKLTDLSQESAIMGTGSFKFRFNVSTNGAVYFQNWYSGGAGTKHLVVTSGGVVAANTWTHIAYIRKSGIGSYPGGRIFINGRDMTADSTSVGPASDAVNVALTIGYSTASAIQTYVKGAIASARIYSRALDEGEINELAQDAVQGSVGQSFNTGATGLLAHYTLENKVASGPIGGTLGGTATTVIDKNGETGSAIYLAGTSGSTFLTGAATGLPSGNAPRTMCAYFSPSAYPSNANINFVSYGVAAGPAYQGFGLALNENSGTHSVTNTFGSSGDLVVAHRLPLNTWSHFCSVYDGTVSTLYINGALMGSVARVLDTVPTTFKIGSWVDNLQNSNGKIDDVRIYNNALSSLQIRQLAVQVPAGLVARYDLSDDIAGAKAVDSSGRGENASIVGATQSPDRQLTANQAYNFNGTGHRIAASDAGLPVGASARSLCAWVRPTAYPAAVWGHIVMYGNPVSGQMDSIALKNSNQITHSAYASDHDVNYAIPLNVWTHLCATNTATTSTIYVNGAAVGSTALSPNTVLGGASGLYIGQSSYDTAQRFTGDIDDVRIYNRVLAAADIRALAGYHPMQAANAVTTMRMHLQADALSNLGNNVALADGDLWRDGAPASMGNGVAANGPRHFTATNGIGGRDAIGFSGGIFNFGSPSITLNGLSICGVYSTLANGASWGAVVEKRNFSAGCTSGGDGSNPCSFAILQVSGQSLTKYEGMVESINIPGALNESILTCSIASDGSTATSVYKNGTSVGGGSVNSALSNNAVNSYPLTVGGRSFGTPDYFNGKIGDLMIFNTSLNATDKNIVECYLSAKYSLPLVSGIVCP